MTRRNQAWLSFVPEELCYWSVAGKEHFDDLLIERGKRIGEEGRQDVRTADDRCRISTS